MSTMRGPRLQVGSAAWVVEERSSALQIVDSEIEEFSFSARNELDWLNEHMAGIFDENENNIAENFKTPGKLRGKTPRTGRAKGPLEARVPLSDVFAATPNGHANRFSQHLNRAKSPQVHRDGIKDSPRFLKSPSPLKDVVTAKIPTSQQFTQDSGYYGSQDLADSDPRGFDDPIGGSQSSQLNHIALHSTTSIPVKMSPFRDDTAESPEKTFQTAKEEQTARVATHTISSEATVDDASRTPQAAQTLPRANPASVDETPAAEPELQAMDTDLEGEPSPSEASSPIRPMVRKSSLNFASLPAREPLTAGKPNGGRTSRLSHLDQHRPSYLNRPTGGKSLGNISPKDDGLDDEVTDNEELTEHANASPGANHHHAQDLAANHNKTYTQRLQDQISMLGKAPNHVERASKSVSDGTGAYKHLTAAAPASELPKSPSPLPMSTLKSTPGAFPDDDDDDWIEPNEQSLAPQSIASPRPNLPKSYSADIMEGVHQATTTGLIEPYMSSPQRQTIHEAQLAPSTHHKSNSTVAASPAWHKDTLPMQKAATVSELTIATSLAQAATNTPLKSPTRSYRESPLKHAKNKLSSIIKSSRGLFASSAAISAEGKSSILSPSTLRLGIHTAPSMLSLAEGAAIAPRALQEEERPDARSMSPTRPVAKRTRASTERDKEERKRDKETRRLEEQNEKLEKARAKEREKARVFSTEQDNTATKLPQPSSDTREDIASSHKTPKQTRTSPRKAKAIEDNAVKGSEPDVEMPDAPLAGPPPRSVGPASALRNREVKRPVRPVKEILSKSKQAPTVIRVNTGSQHSQFHSSSGASAQLAEAEAASIPQPQSQLNSKASKASLQSKPSTQSLRAAASASRAKTTDLAAKKREQEERDAQRRREAKAELERKRLAAQEDQRRIEQQKRQETERQKAKDREQLTQAEAKKNAQRQAAIERAKQTRAPPPAVRSQIHDGHEVNGQDKQPHGQLGDAGRPPSRMASGMLRSQDESGRPLTATLSNVPKPGLKRALPGQPGDEPSRQGLSRPGPSYQAKDAKRRRTSDGFDDKQDAGNPPNIKGPPVRPSGGFKKDITAKPAYASGYANPPQSVTRDLFKATVTSQHQGQAKPAHPLDMAQISKGAIPFAPQPQATGQPTKTPVRTTALSGIKASAAKSVAKSSPKFQNGEAIELPEIQTDDEDEDEDDGRGMVAAWADSPDLRRALLRQETLDPSQIFGPPAPLNMEEVFQKSKDKFHKFRSRTSSANWAGADRLTEEDIRKDLAARDKLRREGGWTYEMSKNLL